MKYEVLPDGTRLYKNGRTYKPLPLDQRKYRVLKPFPDAEDRGYVRFAGKWWPPLELLPEEERQLPPTRPDDLVALHELGCLCDYCKVPRVQRLKRQRLFATSGSS